MAKAHSETLSASTVGARHCDEPRHLDDGASTRCDETGRRDHGVYNYVMKRAFVITLCRARTSPHLAAVLKRRPVAALILAGSSWHHHGRGAVRHRDRER